MEITAMLDGLLFPFESMDRNILAMIMIAVMSAYFGVYIVCKRIVFVGVSLADAVSYAERAEKRLPTEAEWELQPV